MSASVSQKSDTSMGIQNVGFIRANELTPGVFLGKANYPVNPIGQTY